MDENLTEDQLRDDLLAALISDIPEPRKPGEYSETELCQKSGRAPGSVKSWLKKQVKAGKILSRPSIVNRHACKVYGIAE